MGLLSRVTVPSRQSVRIAKGDVEFAEPPPPPVKPQPEDTPYRSAAFVSSRQSADGNGYAVGEPVPEIEWNRQVAEGIVPEPDLRPVARIPCPKCKGTGKRGRGGRNYASHKFNCPCVACIPCKDCGGVGRIEVA